MRLALTTCAVAWPVRLLPITLLPDSSASKEQLENQRYVQTERGECNAPRDQQRRYGVPNAVDQEEDE